MLLGGVGFLVGLGELLCSVIETPPLLIVCAFVEDDMCLCWAFFWWAEGLRCVRVE